jgi:beta-xylosidase
MKQRMFNTMRMFVSCGIFLLLTVASASGAGQTPQEMDVVWSASNGNNHEIFISSMRNDGTWSEPRQVTDDTFENLHPCIDKGQDGRKWLVWTVADKNSFTLRYVIINGDDISEPQDIPSELSVNMAPSVLVDKSNKVWVAWAANNGELDDIYYSTLDDDKSWTEAKPVNSANEVPDILPTLGMNSAGSVQVSWEGFRNGIYRKLQSTWSVDHWLDEVQIDEQEDRNSSQDLPTLPEFVSEPRMAFLRVYK